MKFRFDIEPMGCVRTTRRQLHRDAAAKRYAAWKHAMKLMLRQQLGESHTPSQAAIGIKSIVFHMPIPKDGKGVQLVNGERKRVKVAPGDWHVVKPDTDNCEKSIFDAFNGLFWADDCQVCHIGEVKKVYAERGYIEIDVVELF